MNAMTKQHWVEAFGLGDRKKPDLFLSAEETLGAAHAAAMRLGFAKLNLFGFFCVDSIPAIAFAQLDSLDLDKINTIYRALWNQGLVSLLLIIFPNEIRVYSLAQTPDLTITDTKDARLINTFQLTATALEQVGEIFTGVESGRFFQENSAHFDLSRRVDAELLSNLKETQRRLTTLDSRAAQTLLLQIIFIAYLEDRGIIDQEYFRLALAESRITSLTDLLNNNSPGSLEALFRKLHVDFNGDVFFAPGTFDTSTPPPTLTPDHISQLAVFRQGNVELATGQGRFWPYDFRYIPVELISAIYNRFLGDSPDQRKASGAYYTPHFLADLTVNQVWEEVSLETRLSPQFKVLDPACGSAIFLVRLFQRMVEDWRTLNPGIVPDWNTLTSIVERLHGWDKQASAVRIGIFSLYIALLEEVEPAAILKLLADQKLLPPLFNRTMCAVDFFSDDAPDMKFDVVIGNPPWVSRDKDSVASAVKWCNSFQPPLPMPANELAWAFAWKAMQHTKVHGLVGFLLPAMGVLLNHSEASINARAMWLERIHFKKVINFSDICFLLFDGAERPTALCVFQPCEEITSDYLFDYWCPKADPLLQSARLLTLSEADKICLRVSTVVNDPTAWGKYQWMSSRDLKLFGWLNSLPKLNRNLSTYREAKAKKFKGLQKKWIIGQGFQPAKPEHIGKKGYSTSKSQYAYKFPFYDAKQFTAWVSPTLIDNPREDKLVRRKGFEQGFLKDHILIPQGIERKTGLLRASYCDQNCSFQDSLQAISFPEADAPKMKLLTAVLNSKLAAWFYFHATANLGADRAKVHEAQLLSLPFPDTEDLPAPQTAQEAASSIVAIVDSLLKDKDQFSLDEFPSPATIERLNDLVYQYYGLTEDEISIVEDTVNFVLTSMQPRSNKFPPLWGKCTEGDLIDYSLKLTTTLSPWLKPKNYLSAKLTVDHPDIIVIGLTIQSTSPGSPVTVIKSAKEFRSTLTRINKALTRQISHNFQLLPNLKIFLDETLYLIKPRTQRYWTRSAALNDADSVINELQSVRHRVSEDKHS